MAHTTRRYFAWTLGLSFGIGLPVAAASHGRLSLELPTELMVLVLASPAAAAIGLTAKHAGARHLRRLVWRRGSRTQPRWLAIALATPFAINAAALAAHAIAGGTTPDLPGSPPPDLLAVPLWLVPAVLVTFSALEEIGWRRYALPRLQARTTALAASLLLGMVWAAWHLPMSLTADATQSSIDDSWYVVATLAMSVVFTWLYNSSGGSLTAVTLLHASLQAANVVLPTLPGTTGTETPYKFTVAATALLAAGLVAGFGPRHLAHQHRQMEHPRPTQEVSELTTASSHKPQPTTGLTAPTRRR